jgi:hypothetical protein
MRVRFDHDTGLVEVADGSAGAVVDVEVTLVAAADHAVTDRDRDGP